jgi:rSAM/selenodomain-associated transferase 1
VKKDALIIMAKNPVKGSVKTRLSKTIGEEATLEIYNHLLKITQHIIEKLALNKHIFYSDFIDLNDGFSVPVHHKHLQISHPNLGHKMLAAFHQIFSLGYSNCVIIGTDCPYLSASIIKEAFTKLSNHDVVIGPSVDGGFYLLGCKSYFHLNFDHIVWSTEAVTQQLLLNTEKDNRSKFLLPILEDIDDEESWTRYNVDYKLLK